MGPTPPHGRRVAYIPNYYEEYCGERPTKRRRIAEPESREEVPLRPVIHPQPKPQPQLQRLTVTEPLPPPPPPRLSFEGSFDLYPKSESTSIPSTTQAKTKCYLPREGKGLGLFQSSCIIEGHAIYLENMHMTSESVAASLRVAHSETEDVIDSFGVFTMRRVGEVVEIDVCLNVFYGEEAVDYQMGFWGVEREDEGWGKKELEEMEALM
ncbi:hypothetical protein Moror_6972 [Moniliophthora roreri MCA 2997]|uniref:Uncharacterized protein n=2 Tax=Moniliophthora roreri TaxID=221103 RepID=V2YXM0_MONRO|nr:hypothetical protein Moror_6972 [Moniliophthora roreri MCA 2997]KAI3619591.1 hypothetical protein WG66_002926 [Moniliophthora roreri]